MENEISSTVNTMLMPCYYLMLFVFALMTVRGASVHEPSTVIPLETPLTPEQAAIVRIGYDYVETSIPEAMAKIRRIKLYKDNPELRLHIVKYAWDRTAANKKIELFSSTFGDHVLLNNGDIEVLKYFLKPEPYFNLNHYSKDASNEAKLYSTIFYDESNSIFETKTMIPLMVAVLLNKPEIVELFVDASLFQKLQLDKPMNERPYVTARSMARKIKNETTRNLMLSKLKIDKSKHYLNKITQRLKEDLEITVKEAVIANDFWMLESALLLGNFGDKTDVTIIKKAVESENFLILEALVMEGYAIPSGIKYEGSLMKKEDVDFILTTRTERVPLPTRTDGWYFKDDHNESCF